jgi:NAD(P)-dependent dehydrogenase (short-subunit alcohol dehydrogenase family)
MNLDVSIEPPENGRLAGKAAIVVGAGQTPGLTIGNGRATAIRFAMAGADVLLVDVDHIAAARWPTVLQDRSL